MKRPIFVYGTLKHGYGNYNSLLRGNTEKEVVAKIKGSLYDLGWFPGVVENNLDDTFGELMFIPEDKYDSVLMRVDSLEGYHAGDESHNMYNRKKVVAVGSDGKEYDAYTYIWNSNVNESQKIKNGNWGR